MHELEDHLIETWRQLIAERKAKSEGVQRATLSRDIGMISISPDDRYARFHLIAVNHTVVFP